jgi:tRNA(Ile)-lysidine synthase TilS/MesJ
MNSSGTSDSLSLFWLHKLLAKLYLLTVDHQLLNQALSHSKIRIESLISLNCVDHKNETVRITNDQSYQYQGGILLVPQSPD